MHLQPPRRTRLTVAAGAVAILAALAVPLLRTHTINAGPGPAAARRARGPWIFGDPRARFTIIEYADLECPYCRIYFPTLRQWIEEHPEVNWEWRNLPLSIHEPAARQEAQWAECVGEIHGDAAFWRAVAWIYQHTRGNGEGVPIGLMFPGKDTKVRACLTSATPEAVIAAETSAAAREHVTATPTLKITDRVTGKSLILQGPAEGDVLLSAIDLLAAAHGASTATRKPFQ